MEKKTKSLYILSIVAILAFLGMQVYWLYGRYEYSLIEYENILSDKISNSIVEYNKIRTAGSPVTMEGTKIQCIYNMNTDVDSAGNRKRTVKVITRELNVRKILGIAESRKLTPEEMKWFEDFCRDSIDLVDAKVATVNASSAPSDGVAWNAMRNFETELKSPFTVEGIDSILRKKGVPAEISLIVQSSAIWNPIRVNHSSVISPRLKIITPYSELERKVVVIECKIPSSEVLHKMGWTLAMAVVLSLFLIICLVWQIKTISKLTRLDKMRNSFITTMIHELKRPISTLKMCVSGFDSDKLMEDSALRHELTGETRMALDNLSAYFSKLRDITFNNIEQIPLNITSFNLAQLVNDVIRSTAVPSDRQVRFEVGIPQDMQISADRSHLSNILTNLVENAIKYSRDEVKIKIMAEATPSGVTILVIDNGNGISSTDAHRIFKRFYRGKASSSSDIPGMGLGLAYVKLLVDAHCGEITLESIEGEGSAFYIKLPQ